jgi:hypothetical protein
MAPPGYPKTVFHAFMDEALPDDLCACSFRRHMRTSVHCRFDISQIDSRSDKISIGDVAAARALVVAGLIRIVAYRGHLDGTIRNLTGFSNGPILELIPPEVKRR